MPGKQPLPHDQYLPPSFTSPGLLDLPAATNSPTRNLYNQALSLPAVLRILTRNFGIQGAISTCSPQDTYENFGTQGRYVHLQSPGYLINLGPRGAMSTCSPQLAKLTERAPIRDLCPGRLIPGPLPKPTRAPPSGLRRVQVVSDIGTQGMSNP